LDYGSYLKIVLKHFIGYKIYPMKNNQPSEELKKEWSEKEIKRLFDIIYNCNSMGEKDADLQGFCSDILHFINSTLAKQQEEFVKELATIKRWVMTIRDNNAGTVEDEFVIREKDLLKILK